MRQAPSAFVRVFVVASLVASLPDPSARPATQREVAVAAAPVATVVPTDASLTYRLRTEADGTRRQYGRETLFARGAYLSAATRISTAIAQGQPVPAVPDRAPVVRIGGASHPDVYAAHVNGAIDAVVDASRTVLAYNLHTDAGWSVVSSRLSDGRIRWGVTLIVGWPDPPVATNAGCATNGYCWSTRGLNPHLPWTRNTVTWYLSTANLPSNGESLMKSALATVNRMSGFGADFVYGGLTAATTPSSAHRFLVVFGSGCSTTSALACTSNSTQGSYDFVFQSRIIVSRARYNANPSTSLWVGTLIHELTHGAGLGHYDKQYMGTYQNMRWANGPNSIQAGDANGLRRIAPGGRVTAKIRAARVWNGWDLVVHAANSGLGGIRSITTQCTTPTGAWETVGTASGRFDGKPIDRTVGRISPLLDSTRSCRAIVRSKTSTVTSASVSITG